VLVLGLVLALPARLVRRMVSGDVRSEDVYEYEYEHEYEHDDSYLSYSTITRSDPPRPKVSGMYISSAFGGGTTKFPGVVARAT